MKSQQIPQNVFQIRKDSQINRTVDNIDEALSRFAEVQLSCAGTAIEKMILIAERCVQQGIFQNNEGVAEYSRFTSGLVPHEEREVVFTVAKLRRPLKSTKNQSKPNKQKSEVEKKPVNKPNNNQQKTKQNVGSFKKAQIHQQERQRKQSYNDDHRQRNERRERQNYKEKNERNDREQRKDQGKKGNYTEKNRDRQFR